MPTLASFAAERDIDWRQKLRWIDDKNGRDARRRRGRKCHQFAALAASPVAMVSMQLDDTEGKVEAQNLPGTIDEHSSWQLLTEALVEDFMNHPSLDRIGKLMAENGRDNRVREQREVHHGN